LDQLHQVEHWSSPSLKAHSGPFRIGALVLEGLSKTPDRAGYGGYPAYMELRPIPGKTEYLSIKEVMNKHYINNDITIWKNIK